MIQHLYKIDEVAEILGLSKQAAYLACREGKIPHLRIGKRIRVSQEALEKWIEQESAKTMKAQNQDESFQAAA